MLQFETKSTAAVSALAFSPDGMRLLVGHAKGPVQEWDAFGEFNFLSDKHGLVEVTSIAWAPSGKLWIYCAGPEYWIVENGEIRSGSMASLAATPMLAAEFVNETLLALGKGSKESETGAIRIHPIFHPYQTSLHPVEYENSGVRGIAIHRDSRLVAWITGHAQLKLWRIDRPDKYSIQLKKTATRVTLSPDGSIVAVAVEWGVQTFSTDKRFPLHELKGHKGKVTSLAFSPDGRRIVTGSWDETVREWDVATGKEVRSMQWKIGKISALSYAPDGTRIAAGSTSGKVITWDVD